MKSICSLQIAILAVVLATNAVDAEVLQLAELNTRQIAALDRDKTIVIIAHHMSSLRSCDRLIYLLDGRIADIGTFDELTARNTAFQAMSGAPEQT